MSDSFKLVRIPSLKSVGAFRDHIASLGIDLPCDDEILMGDSSPFNKPVDRIRINGKQIGNPLAIHPMEGWDGTSTGGMTENVVRRWKRFGESGAKLIFGCEAMAVRPDGRANPNQLILKKENEKDLVFLRKTLIDSHVEHHGHAEDLIIGFQLTHSGRFCRPNDKSKWESRVAYRHPLLDPKFNVTSDAQILTDTEVELLIEDYVKAARLATNVGADFVDIKHCHGYLLHEFLGAFTRPGKYGGSFENRTRILREIIAGIRADHNLIDIGVRLSAFDMVPFQPDVSQSKPGKLGPGIPVDYHHCIPYQYGFGVNQNNPVEPDLTETRKFLQLCHELGVKIVNCSAGSPYYNPHIQRPAAYPPSDGYQPAHDPLIDVARQLNCVKALRETAPESLILLGSGYSYLQDYLPQVAQYYLRNQWTDMVGIGRAVLSYPNMLSDAAQNGKYTQPKAICRTFSDCTTAPRNGLISGCYPLDKYYAEKPENGILKEIKKKAGQ